MTTSLPLSVAWRIARRDLSARFRGLRLLLVCLFLGVGAIAAIGTLTGSIERELAVRGRAILGGDLQAELWQRPPTAEETAALESLGTVSAGMRMQAMATAGTNAAPVELKAVDGKWPLVGRLELRDGRKVGAPPQGTAWLAASAAERLEIKPGDTFAIGGRPLKLGGIIAQEPDRLSEGFSLGAAAIVSADLPARAGLTAPGAMYRNKINVALRPGTAPDEAVKLLQKRFPDAGFRFRTRDHATPGVERFVGRMGEFLVLVGLAALAIAGIGIGGGVSSYLEARRGSIATLKVLGATSGDIARIYLLQIGAAALAGSAAGLVAGMALSPLLGHVLGTLLPVAPGFVFDPAALLRASAYGILVALVFAAPPLIRARSFPAMALMRARVAPLPTDWKALLPLVGAGVIAIVVLALATATQVRVTALFLAGTAATLGLLALLGWAIRWLAASVPRPGRPLLRTALANLHRPGAATGALVTALGFGLSAFVLLAAVQTSLEANIRLRVPEQAPAYFVLDVPRDRAEEFGALVRQVAPEARVRTVPSLRGAILAYEHKGQQTRVADLKEIPEGAWALRGERGLTYSDTVPEGNAVVGGKWWPKGYSGPPLVSIEDGLADALGLEPGDRLTIGLLGVERTVTIASIRRIDWQSMGFNYALVFSPNAIADAPHNLAATIDVPDGSGAPGLLGSLVRAFPSSSVIETGGLLRQAQDLLSQMSVAILSAASVAVLAGLAVLFGAIAAARAARMYDNVILRVLGANRRQLLLLQVAEYGLLGGVLALVALALGSAMAWAVVVQLFEFAWLPDWPRMLAVLASGLVLVLGFALAGSLPLLRAKPAQALREL